MATLTIRNPQYTPTRRRPPTYHVYVDGRSAGRISGLSQALELDIPAGPHTIQVKSAQFLGKSNLLNFVAGEMDHIRIHMTEKNTIYMGVAAGFLGLYFLLRVQLNLNFLLAAAIGVAALYTAMALLQPIHIEQITA